MELCQLLDRLCARGSKSCASIELYLPINVLRMKRKSVTSFLAEGTFSPSFLSLSSHTLLYKCCFGFKRHTTPHTPSLALVFQLVSSVPLSLKNSLRPLNSSRQPDVYVLRSGFSKSNSNFYEIWKTRCVSPVALKGLQYPNRSYAAVQYLQARP